MRHFSYLSLSRHNIYYFRWPVPESLKRVGKTNHLKLSLNTREPKEALRLSIILQNYLYCLSGQDWFFAMDYIQIKAIVEDFFLKRLEERKLDINKKGPLLPFPKSHANNMIKLLTCGSSDGVPYDYFESDSSIQHILEEYELNDLSDKDKKIFRELTKKAVIAVNKEVLSYSSNQEDVNFDVKQLACVSRLAISDNKLDRVIDKFMAEMVKSKAWGLRATDERRDCFDYLIEFLGKDFDVPRFDIVTARGVKDALQKTPTNRNKIKEIKDLPLIEQIEVTGYKTLSVGSINKYLQCYNSLFTWAVSHGYADKNPFNKLTMKVNHKKKRDCFKLEQVKTLLDEISKGKSGLIDNEINYWGVLIGLYAGARLNEIASLTPDDIKQDKTTGIWYFDINDDEENKRLKTDAAKRLVPVHQELIRLGLLDFVTKVKDMKGDGLRLLYKLTFSNKEGWGRSLGRWFNNTLLPKLGLKKEGISFHSLRHTVITNLRRSGVDNHNVRALVGHEPDGVTEEVYMHDLGLVQLNKDIQKLTY